MTVDTSVSPPATDAPRSAPGSWAALFGSRVGRRVLLLFFVCAILPLVLAGIIGYRVVARQLTQDAETRVERAAKLSGQSVIERLNRVDATLTAVGRALVERGGGVIPESTLTGLTALTWLRSDGPRQLLGGGFRIPTLGDEARRLDRGEAVVLTRPDSAGSARVLMVRPVPAGPGGGGVLWAVVDSAFLTENIAFVPANADLCLLAPVGAIGCQLPDPAELRALAEGTRAGQGESGARRVFPWRSPTTGERYIAASWDVFLRAAFSADGWTIVLALPRAAVLAPLATFNWTFPVILLLALWAVILLSHVQIRRSLEPLARLTEGTRRLARRDFSEPVVVKSRDEFEELAGAFNTMAGRLDRQFHALEVRSAIDRDVLAALDVDRIAETVLEQVPAVVASTGVALVLADDEPGAPWRALARPARGGVRAERSVWPAPDELAELEATPGSLWCPAARRPGYIAIPPDGNHGVLVLPLRNEGRVVGALGLGYPGAGVPAEDDVTAARQVADQVSVALANARLLDRLHRMNWGTVMALARAIDAKSPWTSGHSERVTEMALALGRRIGLAAEALDNLHRGGLLHDVGKIGVPGSVLDKAGPLTAAEAEIMRSHVVIGAEILEPIPMYAAAIPVVRSHHERWDGSGYPEGLRGEAIPHLARVLAVSDAFDALTSDRPYRQGLPVARALEEIRRNAGRQFDPAVVDVFFAEMAARGVAPSAASAEGASS